MARKGKKNPEKANNHSSAAGTHGEMGLSDHLRELRNRLLICLAVFAVVMIIGLQYAREMVRFLLRLGEQYQYQFVYLSPQELLLEYVSVDFVFSLCVTLPVLLYELWAFLRPGLTKNERLFYVLAMTFGLFSACIGIAFAYKILLPFTLFFLISLSEGSGVQAAVSIQNYVSFLLTIFLVFAAIFELPVVTLLLTQLNLLKIAWMKRFRKIVIVAIFFIAAVITPPDIVSQIIVAIPLLLLYEFSILLCSLAARIRRPKDAEEKQTG